MKMEKLLLLFLLFSSSALASINWQALPFPQINGKFSAVVMKNKDDLLFVYSPYSSNQTIYKSQDAGQHWKAIPKPTLHELHHLISLDDKRLLLAGDNQIYLSKDQGEHWTLSAMIDKSCDKLFSPTPQLVLLTTNGNDAAPRLYRSLDGGETFSSARLGINDGFPFSALGGNENVLLAGTNNLFISTDHGASWSMPSANWADKLLSFAAVNSRQAIFLAANNHLYQTDVTGQTWEALPNEMGLVPILKMDANDGLYAVGQKDDDGLYRSLNNGKTWELLHRFNRILGINLLNNNKILANTTEGLMLSDKSQVNYTKLAELPNANSTNEHVLAFNNDVYFSTALPYLGPLYASTDAGKTWDIKRHTDVIDFAAFKEEVVVLEYEGSNQQIVISHDLGKTWQPAFKISENYCHSLSSQEGGLIVNCNKDSYFTQDLLQWTALKIKRRNPLTTSYFSGKSIYITDGESIQRSDDHGLTWTILLAGLNQHLAYIAGYHDEVLVIAISNAGIIKMTEAGQWDLINNGLSSVDFTSLIVLDAKHYLVSTTAGVFYTENGGQSWRLENSGLSNLAVLSLSFYKNTLLAGTDGSGLFKSSVLSLVR